MFHAYRHLCGWPEVCGVSRVQAPVRLSALMLVMAVEGVSRVQAPGLAAVVMREIADGLCDRSKKSADVW